MYDRLSLERLVKMIDIFEVTADGTNFVRTFGSYDEAQCYFMHPANSARALVLSAHK